MHFQRGRRIGLIAPLALGLIAGLGALGLRAGDVLSTATKFYEKVIDDFDEGFLETIDISKYAHVRFATIVNGTGTVEFFLHSDGQVTSHFEVEASGHHTVDLGEAVGTRLTIQLVDPDGEQVFLRLFGSN
jgi:hypothetical protein